MVTKEILTYIETQIKNGFSVAEIREALITGGWTREDTEMAIATVHPASGGAVDFMPGGNIPKERPPFASANYQPPGITRFQSKEQQRSATPLLPQQPQRSTAPFVVPAEQRPAGMRTSMDSGHTVQLHPSATWSPSVLSGREGTGRRTGRRIVTMLLLVMLTGYGAFLYYRYFRKEAPAVAIPAAFKNLLNASSFRYNADLIAATGPSSGISVALLIPLTGSQETANVLSALFAQSSGSPDFPEDGLSSQDNVSLKIHAEGVFDRHNATHPLGSATVSATVNSQEFGDFSLGGEMRLTQSAAYAVLTEIPPIGIDLSGIKNQWISVDLAHIRDALSGPTGNNSPAPAQSVTSGLTVVEIARFQDIIGNTSFLANITELADESIDGVATSHYGFDVTSSGIAQVFNELVAIGHARRQEQGIAPTVDADIDRAADEAIRAVKKLHGEIWLSQKDLLPRRILVYLSVADEKNPAVRGTVELSVKYTDFNKVYEVKSPAGSRPLAEVLGGVVAQAQRKFRDMHRINDLTQIAQGLQQYAASQRTPLYPSSLSLLTPRFLAVLPTDPASTTVLYNYSPSPDRKSYHLGTSLELLGSAVLGTDTDFNSKKAGWKNGFDGADFKKCTDRDTGITCFDVRP
ncbi:MAG: hypothetical protein Q8Q94_02755 [bacterium]|nr:hypothetical protein [bacterium]